VTDERGSSVGGLLTSEANVRLCRDPCIGSSDSFAHCSRGPLTTRPISLSLGGSVYDPTDAVWRLLFNVMAMVARSESDLIRPCTREGLRVVSMVDDDTNETAVSGAVTGSAMPTDHADRPW
jgi:hypothetical protein